ncbi:hydroxyethylthiazole kinase [Vreelandella nanhaiensis]|uniref:Hydroxyethylthiazole kinase n=1 Tax=Vreelandella nanhaiensis TaxID=1258546 RepID=A0A3S0WHI5_9GAMM|nr:hydroxyethylthiazole kinase [Halomonas nanhaiensis]RUR29083.1 hydroxyethylthiazole kinase [Halomonas nanhaiensis]
MTSLPLSDALFALQRATPLVHCITNYVAMNSTANCLLAIGASPAMLHAPEEVAEFTRLASALSINIGTPSPAWAEGMQLAASTAQESNTPWVFDPVAVGATRYRQTLSQTLLTYQPSAIRGNASEIMALAGLANAGRGVDATASTEEARESAIALAKRQGCIVAMTGESDFITDGTQQWRITGGHALMPRVTTLGCALSACVAAFIAARPEAPLAATATAVASFAIAGARAGQQAAGPGSFQVALLDAFYQLTPEDLDQFTGLEKA